MTIQPQSNRRFLFRGPGALTLAALLVLSGCDLFFPDGSDKPDRPSAFSDDLVNLPFFVRAENGDPIDPETTDPSTPLITDLGRAPVVAPDGHQVTWGEWSDVEGSVSVECLKRGTRVTLDLSGLIPHGVYTIWNVTFEPPGFTGEFEAPAFPANVIGVGPVGPKDGSRSAFLASASGEGSLSVVTSPGELGTLGEIGACALTDEFEWHVVGLYHSDGKTHGPVRGPEGTHAEQFAFIFKEE